MLVAPAGRDKTPVGNGFARSRIKMLETRRCFDLDMLGMTGSGNKDPQDHHSFFAAQARRRRITGRRIFEVIGIECWRYQLNRPRCRARRSAPCRRLSNPFGRRLFIRSLLVGSCGGRRSGTRRCAEQRRRTRVWPRSRPWFGRPHRLFRSRGHRHRLWRNQAGLNDSPQNLAYLRRHPQRKTNESHVDYY